MTTLPTLGDATTTSFIATRRSTRRRTTFNIGVFIFRTTGKNGAKPSTPWTVIYYPRNEVICGRKLHGGYAVPPLANKFPLFSVLWGIKTGNVSHNFCCSISTGRSFRRGNYVNGTGNINHNHVLFDEHVTLFTSQKNVVTIIITI